MHVTLEDAVRTAREVVAEYGRDHRAPLVESYGRTSCRYVIDGKPSCLIGVILDQLGFNIVGYIRRAPFANHTSCSGLFT